MGCDDAAIGKKEDGIFPIMSFQNPPFKVPRVLRLPIEGLRLLSGVRRKKVTSLPRSEQKSTLLLKLD